MFVLYYFIIMLFSLLAIPMSLFTMIKEMDPSGFIYLISFTVIFSVQLFNIYFLVKYIIKLIKREKFFKKEIVFFILAIIAFIIIGLISEWAMVTMVKNAAV